MEGEQPNLSEKMNVKHMGLIFISFGTIMDSVRLKE